MGLGFEGVSDFGSKSGNFLSKPGTYLFACVSIDEAPKGCTGGWGINAIVKGAKKGDEEEIGKTSHGCKFWPPKPTDKDGGEFRRLIQIRAAVALGWVRPKDLKPGEGFRVDDIESASGRLFIATLEKSENDPKYLNLAAGRIFHIDDPAVKDFPIPKELLALIPAEFRIPADEFAMFSGADGKEKKETPPPTGGSVMNEDDLGSL